MDVYKSDIDLDGNIDGNHHLGHIMLECFRKRRPDDIFQIDAGTGEEETYGSVLSRTISMARSLRIAGLRPGDVMSLGGRNHLNLRIPFYAALMNGLPVVGIDPVFKYDEIKRTLKLLRPKISFCEHEDYEQYVRAADELALDTLVLTFYHGNNSMASFMAKYDNDGDEETEEFKPTYFDTDKVWAWLVSTSGSTGANKFVAIRHGTAGLQYLIRRGAGGSFVENGQKTCLNVSSVQWISSYLNVMNMPLMNSIILQSSKIAGVETYIDIINKYKPATAFVGPSLISLILRNKKMCDLTCLDVICVAGAKVYKETLLQLRARVRKDTVIHEVYGHSETMGGVLCSDGPSPTGSCFADTDLYEMKLIDATTGAEVVEPHKQGELFVKGPGVFSEYYNDPEETAKGFSKDGFYKTGDVFYRDEYRNYYFVERLKMLIKCRGTQIIPPELEEVIAAHPDVLEVCVTGIPHPEDEERPVACVVRTPGSHISAQDIKNLVTEKLSEGKELRGGVLFMEELPKTTSGKVARMEIKKLVASLKRE